MSPTPRTGQLPRGLGRLTSGWLLPLVVMGACALPPLPMDAIDVSVGGYYGQGDARPAGDFDIHFGDLGPGGDGVRPGDADYPGVTCDDAGEVRVAIAPAPGELVIAEVFANPAGVDLFKDWLEIEVVSAGPVDLNDLRLVQHRAQEAPREVHLIDEACRTFIAGDRVVVGASTNTAENGGVNVDWAAGLLQLFNGATRMELWVGPTLIDEALVPDPITGVSLGLDPNRINTSENDDPLNFCPATTTGVFNETGTPGAQNDPCD